MHACMPAHARTRAHTCFVPDTSSTKTHTRRNPEHPDNPDRSNYTQTHTYTHSHTQTQGDADNPDRITSQSFATVKLFMQPKPPNAPPEKKKKAEEEEGGICMCMCAFVCVYERVLFIGTQFSILYTCSSAYLYTLLEFSHKDNRTDDDEEDDDGEVSSAPSAATPVSTKKSGSKKSRYVLCMLKREYLGFQRFFF